MDFPVRIPNQMYMLMSYVADDTVPKCKNFALRVYGTFASKDEADEVILKARERGYTFFDMFVVDIAHGFFPLPPPKDEDIDEVKYVDECLNNIMGRHKEMLNTSSQKNSTRADAELDDRSVVDVFDEMVQRNARNLFLEWKKAGRQTSNTKILKKKIKNMYYSEIDKIIQSHEESQDEEEEDVTSSFASACSSSSAVVEELDVTATETLPVTVSE
jgi:hypothetical protein